LDTRIDLAAAPTTVFDGKVSELIGAEIAGPGMELLPGIRACALTPTTARQLDEHFWLNEVGGGKAYFGNFYDYPADFSLVDKITELLETIGENVRTATVFQIETSSPYIHYSVWEHEGKKTIYAVDADWRKSPEKPSSSLTVREGEDVRQIVVESEKLTVV